MASNATNIGGTKVIHRDDDSILFYKQIDLLNYDQIVFSKKDIADLMRFLDLAMKRNAARSGEV